MRNAISCFARPVLGLPIRRALASSTSVDSGMSLKSISRSEVYLPFVTRRLARADDADCFFAIVCLPQSVRDHHYAGQSRAAKSLEPRLVARMLLIGPIKRIQVAKDGRRFLKRNVMLLEVSDRLSRIPREHLPYIH